MPEKENPAKAVVKEKPRYEYLDIAKGLAAAFVVILHILNTQTIFYILSPWHIWQAMPIFLFIAGITGAMSCRKYKGITGNLGSAQLKADLRSYYSTLPSKIMALYIPYIVVIFAYHLWTRGQEDFSVGIFFDTLIFGKLGPGGYFVPLIITHLIVFPLFLAIRGRLSSDLKFLGVMLLFSIAAELLFAFCDVPASKFEYRAFYFRYLFACSLGAVLVDSQPFSNKIFTSLVCMSVVYMAATTYCRIFGFEGPFWNLPIIRADDWYFQHYPAFFYTAFLVLAIRKYEPQMPGTSLLIKLGKSSYDIFIFQMLFLITVYSSVKQNFFPTGDIPMLLKLLTFFICIYGGLYLTKVKNYWNKTF